ncbi:carotenoid biosynthesis protein [Halobacillus fulvus]|nr:carotenoid biosynthesis protein [Halobacillus fulvus]
MADKIYKFFIFWYICGVILLTFNLLPPWLEWANSVFLIAAGVVGGIYFIKIYHWVFGLFYSLFIIIVSIYVEHLGVETDFLFGAYSYTDNFGLKIFDTPITIGFAWLLIMGCSHEIARGITDGMKKWKRFVVFLLSGSLLAVTMDLILDPVSFKVKEYWIWEEPGLYYDIPFSNFTGWFILAAVFHLVYLIWSPKRQNTSDLWPKRMALVFGLIILMFIILALTGGLWLAVGLVTVLTILWYAIYFWRRSGYAASK